MKTLTSVFALAAIVIFASGCDVSVKDSDSPGPVIVDDQPDVTIEDKAPDVTVEDKSPDINIIPPAPGPAPAPAPSTPPADNP
jgi:hypothetical protein